MVKKRKTGCAEIDLFGEGSLVEVSSEADGSAGVWYVARVLERSGVAKNEEIFLVEYQRLHSNGNTKLIKPVNSKFIRPLPPPSPSLPANEDQTFEVDDVVDGYLVDGWCVGVVFQVLEEPTRGYSVLLSNPYDLINFRPSDLRLHLDWVGDKWVRPPKQLKQQKQVETSNQKRHGAKECDGAKGDVGKMIVEDSTAIGVELAITKEPAETATELPNSVSKDEDTEVAIVPSNITDVDEPTSCFPAIVDDSGMCGRTINQSSEPKEKSTEIVRYDARVAMIDNMPYKDQNLQLLENSPVMLFIESMEVFQSLPQRPHFRPLGECEEVKWEGLAVGHMMTFANVVKKISELHVNAPRCNFDSLSKCLPELELHGFDVKAVQTRLLELQSVKENQEQLKTKLEKIRSEIMEHTHERTKVNTEFDIVMNDLKVLQEKKKAVEEKVTRPISANNDSEIAKLEGSVASLKEEIQKVKHSFESVAASPWR